MNGHISEVANNVTAETMSEKSKNQEHIPNPVMLKTKGGDTIILAPSTNGYDKYYFAPVVQNFDSAKPNKVKTVKFPVNREGIIFNNCSDLFTHLVKNCGYKRYH